MITQEKFGTLPTGEVIELYTLANKNGMAVKISTFGGTLTSILVPDREKKLRNVVLGYDDLTGYMAGNEYFSATIGRCGNRIAGGRFTLNGTQYILPCNERGVNHLHGGSGFNRKVWDASVEGDALLLTYRSPDGEDGYPGNLTAQVRFSLDAEGGLHLCYRAETDRDTLCNLTNHAYFNLRGEGSVLGHELCVHADAYTKTDADLIPVANVPVADTPYDFRTPRAIGKAMYDNNFVLTGDAPQATLYEKESGIEMSVSTDLPGVQVYSASMLPRQKGRGGAIYDVGDAVCLETQFFPDSPNHPEFTPCILRTGDVFTSETVYRFRVR